MAEPANFGGVVHVTVSEKVTLDNLRAVIESIGRMRGCTGCGLMGVDLRITGDPIELQQITKIPGVLNATFGE